MLNLNFKEWFLSIDEVRIAGSAMAHSNDPVRQSGRDANIIVPQILKNKFGWNYRVTSQGGYEDVNLKIDGYFLNGDFAGKSYQLATRSAEYAKSDVPYRMTSHPMPLDDILDVPFKELMKKNPSKASATSVDLHLLKTADDDLIFICEDSDLKASFNQLLSNVKPYFTRNDIYRKDNGFGAVFSYGRNQIRLTYGVSGYGLTAYINASENAIMEIPITEDDNARAKDDFDAIKKDELKAAAAEKALKAQIPEGMTDLQFDSVMKVIDGSLPYFTMQVSNNANKRSSVEKFLKRKNLEYKTENIGGKPTMKITKKV